MNPANALSQLSPGMAECHARLMAVAKHGTPEAFSATLAAVLQRAELSISNAYDAGAKSIQIEAIGACGVSGPLVGQPQAVPDLSQLTERGAVAWAGVDAQGLRECFTAADVATAAARGFGDGAASLAASVGSELVYQARYQKGFWQDSSRERYEYLQNPENTCAEDWETRILYTHPSPPEGMAGWTTLPGQMPEPNTPVLLDIGKKFPIRALWAEKHTVRVGTDVDDWGEYDEETDEYYCPEGWYEWNEHEEVHWAVSETPRAWMPLPPTSAEGVEHGPQ